MNKLIGNFIRVNILAMAKRYNQSNNKKNLIWDSHNPILSLERDQEED
jgi:hypothetical protein